MSDSPNPLADQTPMERLQARLATVTDRKRPLMQMSVESGDLRWALSEITRLTADSARKDSAILKAKFTGYPAHGTGFVIQVTGYDDIYAIQQELRAAASARGEGGGR